MCYYARGLSKALTERKRRGEREGAAGEPRTVAYVQHSTVASSTTLLGTLAGAERSLKKYHGEKRVLFGFARDKPDSMVKLTGIQRGWSRDHRCRREKEEVKKK